MFPQVQRQTSGIRGVGRVLLAVGALGLLVGASVASQEPGPAADAAIDQKSAPVAVIVPIIDEINDVTLRSMERRFDDARARGAGIVVLELDTPGGLVTSALSICNYLKNVTDLKTVAWVRPHAFSAGSMIAVACDEIVVSSSSRMGDCAPIMMSPTEGLSNLGKTERAKAESPILKEFRDSAHRRGYDPLLCESMVRIGNEVYWIENPDSGEKRFVRGDERDAYVKPPDEGAATGPAWRLVTKMIDPLSGRELDVQQPVVAKNDLLTLTQTEAVWFGFARSIVSSESELREFYGLRDVLRLETNWAEQLAAWLSSPIVRSVLFVLMLMGAYAEFHAPGHMVGGAVALVCLALFLGAPYITGLANIWEIVVVILGVGLLAVELFVTPGFGVPGVLGLALVLVGLVASFVQPELPDVPVFFHWPRMEATWHGVRVGVSVVSGGLILGTIGAYVLSRILPRSPLMSRIITPNPTPEAVLMEDPYPCAAQVGDIGTAESLLRPAGKARFGPILVDVVSESEYIPAGSRVQVIDRRGNRVVVRRLRD